MMTLQEMIKSFENLSEDEQESLLEILCQYRAKARERGDRYWNGQKGNRRRFDCRFE
jgi:hypothetical protein